MPSSSCCAGRPLETIRILDEAAELSPRRTSYDAPYPGPRVVPDRAYSEAADCFLRLPQLSCRRRLFLAAMLAKAGRLSECVAQSTR